MREEVDSAEAVRERASWSAVEVEEGGSSRVVGGVDGGCCTVEVEEGVLVGG